MSDRTLVLLKPDAVERGLVGQILSRFEAKGLKIVAMDLRTLDQATLARHYEEHVGKGFYADLVAFMSRGPVVARERFSRDAAADAFDRLFSAVIDRHRPGARTEPVR